MNSKNHSKQIVSSPASSSSKSRNCKCSGTNGNDERLQETRSIVVVSFKIFDILICTINVNSLVWCQKRKYARTDGVSRRRRHLSFFLDKFYVLFKQNAISSDTFICYYLLYNLVIPFTPRLLAFHKFIHVLSFKFRTHIRTKNSIEKGPVTYSMAFFTVQEYFNQSFSKETIK